MLKYTRISIKEAKRRFCLSIPFNICPHKLRPGFPFACDITIMSGKEWLFRAIDYKEHNPVFYTGTPEKIAWNLMYDNWAYYNTSWETGYYAWFYDVKEVK